MRSSRAARLSTSLKLLWMFSFGTVLLAMGKPLKAGQENAFLIDDFVLIKGLQERQELNGKWGWIARPSQNGRYGVMIWGERGQVGIKPSNLEPTHIHLEDLPEMIVDRIQQKPPPTIADITNQIKRAHPQSMQRKGQMVVLTGLGTEKYNGRRGEITQEANDSGRYPVKLFTGDREVLAIKPENLVKVSPESSAHTRVMDAMHYFVLGTMFGNQGNMLAALGSYGAAVDSWNHIPKDTLQKIDPYGDRFAMYTQYLQTLLSFDIPQDRIRQIHKEFNELVMHNKPASQNYFVDTNPDKEVVTVGLISRDFGNHPVVNFLMALSNTLRKTHFPKIKFKLYSLSFEPAQELKYNPAWDFVDFVYNPDLRMSLVHGLHDEKMKQNILRNPHIDQHVMGYLFRSSAHVIADRIRRDKVDVLVDMHGVFSPATCHVMAHKPAPVQAHYLAYPGTTGLSAIDYRICDETTDPEDTTQWFSEKLWRLKDEKGPVCFLNYSPVNTHTGEPRLNEYKQIVLPANRNGFVTFCSANEPIKITDEELRIWANVLRAVYEQDPDRPPRFIMKINKEFCEREELQKFNERLRSKLRFFGVPNDVTIDFKGFFDDQSDMYKFYNEQCDIALDTMNYCGTTTTMNLAEAGVPTLTLLGATHSSRVSGSLNKYLGGPMEQFNTTTEEEFVEMAKLLAKNTSMNDARFKLAQEARSHLLAIDWTRKPVDESQRHTRALLSAFREMFRKWAMEQQAGPQTA